MILILRGVFPFLAVMLMFLTTTASARAQAGEGLLIPMGGGYSDLYPGLMATLTARTSGDAINIVVLPTTYSTSAAAITPGEVEINLRDAETRRKEIEGACQRAAPDGVTCRAVTAPIFTRADAENPAHLAYFGDDVAAVFILGGDQMVAMQALANTPVEAALAAIYARGGVIAGTSAGAAVQSRAMIADYSPNYGVGRSFDAGAAAVWDDEEQRGLDFGVAHAILDQHFFQRGRLGRLIDAILRPDLPKVGVGVDAYTGVQVFDGAVLTNTFGLYTVAVLDAATYDAAGTAQTVGERQWLSVRNLLVHLLAPGDFGYDLAARRHSLAAPTPMITRTLALTLPAGAGPLFVAGGLEPDSAAYGQFTALITDTEAPLLVVVAGYPNDRAAARAAGRLAAQFSGPVTTTVVSSKGGAPLLLDGPYRGIIVTGRDQSLLKAAQMMALREQWLAGVPLLLDAAAAALAGPSFSAHEATPEEGEAAEKAAQRSFLEGRTVITGGLGLLPIAVEPDVIENNRWGRLFSLAYAAPDTPAFGLGRNTALALLPEGVSIIGEEVVVSLDLRPATLAWGANRAFVMANGLLDVFAPGDAVVYAAAETRPGGAGQAD